MRPRHLPVWIVAVVAMAAAVPSGAQSPWEPVRPAPSLQNFVDQRRLEAATELRALSRDADRKNQEAWLRSHGTPAEIEQYARRVRSEDALDRLIDHQELARLPLDAGLERFGPATRRLLERSRIELRWLDRRRDSELRLHELERAVAPREAVAPAFVPTPEPFSPAP